ncbi:sensor histidine kinase [Frankia sp. EI5c]|uniref:sensor histidine kinase n=1 Tax=Frankia sp. EI5c TaxID=683316 RepID=UPI0037BEF2E8
MDVESLPATDLPEEVVRALAGATQELLANVRRHARTDHATLAVSHLPGGVEVVVADGGRGFAVQEVPDDRLGLARSVHARLAEVGGRATITSGDGLGTTARLTWSAAASATAGSATAGSATAGTAADGTAPGLAEAARPADPRPTGTAGTAGGAARRRPGAGAATRRRRVHRRGPATVPAGRSAAELRDSYAAALRRATAVGAAAWFSCTVVVLLVTLPGSRSVPLAVLCWLAMALLVAAAAITTHRRSLRSGEAAALMTLALAVTVVVGLNSAAAPGSPGAGGPASRIATWPVFVLPVLLALVAVSRLFVEWLAALVATVVVLGLLVLTGTNPGTFALAQLLAATNGQVALQLTVSMAGPVLRRTADQVARAIEQETARTALERSAQAVRADRERGLATIEREVLPLLEAVADGLLDPRDRAVRERCGSRATAIRQALVAGAAGGLGELAPAVVEARSRGLEVEVRLDGETRRIPPPVLERLVGVLPTLLGEASAAGAGRVVLTLIHDDAGGRLFLTYPADDPPAGDTLVGVPAGPAGSELVSVTADVDEGQVWIEVAWSAADRRTGTP